MKKETPQRSQVERELTKISSLAIAEAISEALPRDLLEQRILFSTLRYCVELDATIPGKGPRTEIPFHRLLSHFSPRYRWLFQMGNRLHIKISKTDKCKKRLAEEFNPFSGRCEHTFIWENLQWILTRAPDEGALEELHRILCFNVPVIHDLAHAVFSHLLCPKQGDPLRQYYFLVEALVMIQEEVMAYELGPILLKPLSQSLTCFDSPAFAHQQETEFVRRLKINFSQKSKHPQPITLFWLKNAAPKFYPKSLRGVDPDQITVSQDPPEVFKLSGEAKRISAWHSELLEAT